MKRSPSVWVIRTGREAARENATQGSARSASRRPAQRMSAALNPSARAVSSRATRSYGGGNFWASSERSNGTRCQRHIAARTWKNSSGSRTWSTARDSRADSRAFMRLPSPTDATALRAPPSSTLQPPQQSNFSNFFERRSQRRCDRNKTTDCARACPTIFCDRKMFHRSGATIARAVRSWPAPCSRAIGQRSTNGIQRIISRKEECAWTGEQKPPGDAGCDPRRSNA